MQRLAYVRERSVLPEKDSLYLGALELLRSRVPEDACEAEVMVAMARWHEEQADKYERLRGDDWKWERKAALDLCKSAVGKWPGSFGARNAASVGDKAKYDADVKGFVDIAFTDMPRIPLYQPFVNVAMQKNVSGYQYWFHRRLDYRALVKA